MTLLSKEDGGFYGWIVVAACFMSKCLIVDYFGEGAGKTALLQSLATAMMTIPSQTVMALFSKEDGGFYRWIVVAACFSSKCLIVGCSGSGMGVFLVKFLDYFGEGAGKTALLQSLATAMMTIPSPMVSSLNSRFGTRPLVVIGGVISSVALFLCSFANRMAYGLIYGPTVVIIGQYFHKRHALANGFMYAGISVGIMIFPPLHHKLIETYGWRGAMIFLAGINLNMVVCGMLMRPPGLHTRVDKKHSSKNTEDQKLLCNQ
uniref:Monocarboxylate transporter 9-like n=1 Tax=Saccoglossus kowalevskii TaxID=10224 RepID=A0ABM0MEZ2_SACKO|nr:PREDICTED: monocarboxylate transporter 9-like [Saccoglossus kowalevskii]